MENNIQLDNLNDKKKTIENDKKIDKKNQFGNPYVEKINNRSS